MPPAAAVVAAAIDPTSVSARPQTCFQTVGIHAPEFVSRSTVLSAPDVPIQAPSIEQALTPDAFSTELFIHPGLVIRPHTKPDRGICVVTTEPIPAGTLLMREPPVLTLPTWALTVPDLRQRWKALDDISKVKIWSLASGGFHAEATAAAAAASAGGLLRYSSGNSSPGTGNFASITPAMRRLVRSVPCEPQLDGKLASHGFGAHQFSDSGVDWSGGQQVHPWARMLALAHSSTKPSVLRVFATNAIALPAAGCDGGTFDGWGEGGAGIFVCISRVNHSCVPNAGLWFKHHDSDDRADSTDAGGFQPDLEEPRGVMELRATRALAKGEEVFITYTDPYQSREQRLEALSSYGFECACPACDPNGIDPLPPVPSVLTAEEGGDRLSPTPQMRSAFFEGSMARRARIERIDGSLPSSGRFLVGGSRDIRNDSIARSRLRAAFEMVGLLKQESLLGARLARV